MPTNSTKHAMLKLAKQIANTEFKDTTEIMERDISKILKEHPEFDPGNFRQMIKELQVRNKQIRNKHSGEY